MTRFVELSHDVEAGMSTYPGIPGPVIRAFLTREQSRLNYAPGTEFYIGTIEMAANTGTYVDSPFHRYAEGADLAGLPLERLANLEGIVIRAADGRAIDEGVLEGRDLAGKAVLFATGWDQHWRTPQYAEGHPYLTRAAAERLVAARTALAGIDSLNIDDTRDLARPAHSLLLAAGIPIVEHMRGLGELPDTGFRFFAVPPKVRAFGSFPVRAFAIL